jgi:hypothetical protein
MNSSIKRTRLSTSRSVTKAITKEGISLMGKLNLIYGRHVVEEFLTKHPTMVKKI